MRAELKVSKPKPKYICDKGRDWWTMVPVDLLSEDPFRAFRSTGWTAAALYDFIDDFDDDEMRIHDEMMDILDEISYLEDDKCYCSWFWSHPAVTREDSEIINHWDEIEMSEDMDAFLDNLDQDPHAVLSANAADELTALKEENLHLEGQLELKRLKEENQHLEEQLELKRLKEENRELMLRVEVSRHIPHAPPTRTRSSRTKGWTIIRGASAFAGENYELKCSSIVDAKVLCGDRPGANPGGFDYCHGMYWPRKRTQDDMIRRIHREAKSHCSTFIAPGATRKLLEDTEGLDYMVEYDPIDR